MSDVNRRDYLRTVGTFIVGAAVGAAAGIGGYEMLRPKPSPSPTAIPTPTMRTFTPHFLSGESDPDSISAWQKIFQGYTNAHPNVLVKDEYVTWEEGLSRAMTLAAAGTPVDIWYQSAGGITEPAREGLIDFESNTEVADAMNIPAAARPKYQGKDLAAGNIAGNIEYFWYRTDVFEKNGLDPYDFPTTWNGLLDVCAQIDSPDMRAIGLITGATFAGAEYNVEFFWGNGVKFMDTKGDDEFYVSLDETPNKEKAVETIEFLVELSQYSPPAIDWNYGELLDAFATEKVAIEYYIGARMLNVTIQRNPPVEEVMHFAPTPKPEIQCAMGEVQGYTMFKKDDPELVEVTKDLIKYLLRPESVVPFLHAVPLHDFPVTEEVWESDVYLDNPIIQRHLDLKDFLKDYIKVMRSIANPHGFDKPLNPYWNAVVYGPHRPNTILEKVIYEGADPETAIEDEAEKMRADFEEVKG